MNPWPRLIALARSIRADGRLLLAFLALAVLALVFLKLASEVVEGDTMAFDRWVMLALRHPDHLDIPVGVAWLQIPMRDITAIGGSTGLTLITLVITGFLLVARKFATAAFVFAAIAGGALLSVALKSVFLRPRPEIVPHLVLVDTTSFPSGHAMNSAIVFLTLGALLTRTQKDRTVRIYLVAVAILLTLLVGFSRVYLGVHWPSDVIAGWIVGAGWATFCLAIARLLQARRQIEQPDETSDTLDGDSA
ncbi:MAG: phosphatase PAP2 family protein [Pseudomonadota bacterium]